MTRSLQNFEACIDPIRIDEFFSTYWEQKALTISRKDPTYFADLISSEAIDYILSSTDLRIPAFRLVKSGEQLAIDDYTFNIQMPPTAFQAIADINKVYAEYQNGATIVLQALERSWSPLIHFCKNLEHFLDHPVQANVYLTPLSRPQNDEIKVDEKQPQHVR